MICPFCEKEIEYLVFEEYVTIQTKNMGRAYAKDREVLETEDEEIKDEITYYCPLCEKEVDPDILREDEEDENNGS